MFVFYSFIRFSMFFSILDTSQNCFWLKRRVLLPRVSRKYCQTKSVLLVVTPQVSCTLRVSHCVSSKKFRPRVTYQVPRDTKSVLQQSSSINVTWKVVPFSWAILVLANASAFGLATATCCFPWEILILTLSLQYFAMTFYLLGFVYISWFSYFPTTYYV